MPGDELILARDAALGYPGAEPVVTGLDLSLASSTFAVVLGPNGGGKTTLFRALSGELTPLAGELNVRAPLAYLPQYDGSRIDFPVSARDVVMMGLLSERSVWRRATRGDRRRAEDALERVGLGDRAGDTFGELSGGQRRRVLLARTIVGGARIVLLDEPLAGVDPASERVIRTALSGLRDEGRLVIEASHDIEHARSADRVVCINHRVIADGEPAEALTEDALRATYAHDLAVIGDGTMITTDGCGEEHAGSAAR